MTKKEKAYEEWDLYNYEKQVNSDSFVQFLKFILEKDGINKVVEILKASGYFISYNTKVKIIDKQKENIDKFVNLHFTQNGLKKYESLKKEAFFLQDKRNYIGNKISFIIDQYKISSDDLIYFFLWNFNNIDMNNEISPEQKVSKQEYYVFILGFLLKLMMYSGNKSIEKKEASPNEFFQLYNYTFMYREMNEIIQSWMFGEVKVEKDEFLDIEELPGKNKDRIISASNYWDIKDSRNLSASIIEIDKTENWQERFDRYINMFEENVKEDFYTQNFQEEYLDIQLLKWMEIFKIFSYKAYKSKEPILKLKKEQLLKEISSIGLSISQAEEILKNFIFEKTSKDLFDSFLIEQNEELLFISGIYRFINHPKAMMSLFGKAEKKDGKVEQKGTAFEYYLFSLICKNIQCIEHNISINCRNEKYELDIVFLLDGDLFICECKTQYQHEDMRGYYKNLTELEMYLRKFERNYKFFVEQEEGRRMISQKLNIQSYNNIYPIFISNVVFVESKINGIYITDDTRIYRYMTRKPAGVVSINSKKKVVNYFNLFPQYYEGEVTAPQFVEFLNNKPNELEVEQKKVVLQENYTLNEFNVISKRYMENKQVLENVFKL